MDKLKAFADVVNVYSKELEKFLDKDEYFKYKSDLITDYMDNVLPVVNTLRGVDPDAADFLAESNTIYIGLEYIRILEELIKGNLMI